MIRLNRQVEVRLRNLPLAARIIVGVSGVLALCTYGSIGYMLFRNHLIDESFTEINKCPACYGTSYCSKFKQGRVKLSGWSKTRWLDFANVKNIHYGQAGLNSVVLKKLGHDRDIKALDQNICKLAVERESCDPSRVIEKVKILEDLTLDTYEVEEISDSLPCISQRLVSRFIEGYKERKSLEVMALQDYAHFLTTFMVNPEPLIIQAFSQREGWPFPKYLGACGRYVVEEYAGDTLASYYNAPWEERIDLASQILEIADIFTENKDGFAFYWTKLDFRGLAVNSEGRVIVMDVGNIIIIDKEKIKREKPKGWDVEHVTTFEECDTEALCDNLKIQDLCVHQKSDLNYYIACKNVLSDYATRKYRPGGLLHNLPSTIDKEYRLTKLLEMCVKPPDGKGRFSVKEQLLNVLQKVKLQYY